MAWQIVKGSDVPVQLDPDRVLYNPDGSSTSLPADDDVVSRRLICDICGTPFDDKGEVIRQDNKVLHSECIDEER